jgi:guanylate kinase
MEKPWILVLSAPSGAGKSTLIGLLRKDFPRMRFSVSHTTRKQRGSEANGSDYHFTTPDRFTEMVSMGRFAEYAYVHGEFYGTSVDEVEKNHVPAGCAPWEGVILDVDRQGARQVKSMYPDAVCVFIVPPSISELGRRLRARGTDEEEKISARLSEARREMEHYGMYDYLVVNDSISQAYEELKAIVTAEKCKTWRSAPRAEAVIKNERLR